jgi:hypothetical protein
MAQEQQPEHQVVQAEVIRPTMPVDVDIQNQLDIVMAIIDENQDKMTDGEYLRAMNALGSLHKHKRTAFGGGTRHRAGGGGGAGGMERWLTLDDICDDDELYDEVMELADEIIIELCGDDSSIYASDDTLMVSRGEEEVVFDLVVNYKPEEGNAGYDASPLTLHCALQMITLRLFKDTHHELETVRPVSCQCGWRGAQGNWDRHIRNERHQRWVAREENRKAAVRAAAASLAAAAAAEAEALALENDEDYQVTRMYRAFMDASDTTVATTVASSDTTVATTVAASDTESDPDVIYIDEERLTPDSQRGREELIAAAVAAGKRVVYIHHTTTQWRRIQ